MSGGVHASGVRRISLAESLSPPSAKTGSGAASQPCVARPPELRPATRESYREAMRQLAGAVCVATFGRGRDRAGLTATSVVSLSADPPTLLFCIQRNASAYAALAASDAFAINVLGADQREFAERFSGAGGLQGGDRYHGDAWRELPSGAAGLANSAAIFDCELEERLERASHAIVIGRVRQVIVGDVCSALLYWRASYDYLGWRQDELDRANSPSLRGAG